MSLESLQGGGVESAAGKLRLPGRLETERLGNGLQLVTLRNPAAPVVTVALFYRVGTRDEVAGQAGIAHFLEHMMFKGSARFPPGEVDVLTQRLGGVNNAFTSHDTTAYYFQFAPDRWHNALAIEADRMAGLRLDERDVESERRVILEEIAMYDGDPWSRLDKDVTAALFPGHPYGLPVLGTSEELLAIGREELAAFHWLWYRPDNAVLVVAGDVGDEVPDRVEECFFGESAGGHERGRLPPAPDPSGQRRLERRQGSVSRLLLALSAPPASSRDYTALRLLSAVLTVGRSSRLQRELVEERRLCLWLLSDLREHEGPGMAEIALELVPGVEPGEVEERVQAALAELRERPVTAAELDRARRQLVSDWVFDHERVHQQALAIGHAAATFDLDHVERSLRRLQELEPGELLQAARRWLDPLRDAVLGWSYPGGER